MTITTKRVLQSLYRSSYLHPVSTTEIAQYVWPDKSPYERQLYAMRYLDLLRNMDFVQYGDGYRGYCLAGRGREAIGYDLNIK